MVKVLCLVFEVLFFMCIMNWGVWKIYLLWEIENFYLFEVRNLWLIFVDLVVGVVFLVFLE